MGDETTRDAVGGIRERLADAAIAHARERAEVRRSLTEAVLGANRSRDVLGEIVTVGRDHLVEVIDRARNSTWTTVVSGRNDRAHFYTVDMALVHLLARRHGATDMGTTAGFAARVLGFTDDTGPEA